jgi:hypothetical protein
MENKKPQIEITTQIDPFKKFIKQRMEQTKMSFDGIMLSTIKTELEKKLCGARIDKIYQPQKQQIILHLRQKGTSYKLLLSSLVQEARVHLISQTVSNPAQLPLFCIVLRKHLEGRRLLSRYSALLKSISASLYHSCAHVRLSIQHQPLLCYLSLNGRSGFTLIKLIFFTDYYIHRHCFSISNRFANQSHRVNFSNISIILYDNVKV